MGKTSGIVTLAALALGLMAGPAWATNNFTLVNSSGATISANCSGTSAGGTVVQLANGTSQSFSCSGNLEFALTTSNSTTYSISNSCSPGEILQVTATAGINAGELSLARTCKSSSG